jgi:hypothetical protein
MSSRFEGRISEMHIRFELQNLIGFAGRTGARPGMCGLHRKRMTRLHA